MPNSDDNKPRVWDLLQYPYDDLHWTVVDQITDEEVWELETIREYLAKFIDRVEECDAKGDGTFAVFIEDCRSQVAILQSLETAMHRLVCLRPVLQEIGNDSAFGRSRELREERRSQESEATA